MFWPAATIQGAGSLRDCKCKRRSWSAIGSMPRVFLDGLGVGISLIDAPTGHIRFANKEYCRILGYSEQELTRGSVSFLELTHPDDRERSDAEHRRLLNGEIPQYRLDKRCLRGDGNLVWVHVTVNAIRGSKGEVRWCSAAVEDIGTPRFSSSSSPRPNGLPGSPPGILPSRPTARRPLQASTPCSAFRPAPRRRRWTN